MLPTHAAAPGTRNLGQTLADERRSPESYASQRARDAAYEVLSSYEKLSWMANARCESIAQTRLHFQKLASGYREPEGYTEADIESGQWRGQGTVWREDFTPQYDVKKQQQQRGKGKGKRSADESGGAARDGASGSGRRKSKGKERASEGGGEVEQGGRADVKMEEDGDVVMQEESETSPKTRVRGDGEGVEK